MGSRVCPSARAVRGRFEVVKMATVSRLCRPYNRLMSSVRPWPKVPPGAEWVIEEMEDALARSKAPPEDLIAHANELRAQAEAADNEGSRYAALAVAERYEQLAAARLSST
jgi:hypothetical protein